MVPIPRRLALLILCLVFLFAPLSASYASSGGIIGDTTGALGSFFQSIYCVFSQSEACQPPLLTATPVSPQPAVVTASPAAVTLGFGQTITTTSTTTTQTLPSATSSNPLLPGIPSPTSSTVTSKTTTIIKQPIVNNITETSGLTEDQVIALIKYYLPSAQAQSTQQFSPSIAGIGLISGPDIIVSSPSAGSDSGIFSGALSVGGTGTSTFASGINLTGSGCVAVNGVCLGVGAGSGSVTSVALSGASTGLTFSGGPITTSGTITLGGILGIGNGGTGTSTLPTANKVLLSDANGNWEYVATSSLGISGGGSGTVTSVGLSGGTTGLTVTGTNPITGSGTFTLGGVLAVANGGTNISTPTAAGVLVGNYAGTGYQQIATSSLGLTTTNVAQGTNLYFTNANAQAAISVAGLPLTYSAGVVGINQATASQAGYLSSVDWTNFNNKISSSSLSSTATGLTYTPSSGVFSLTSGYNIPLSASTTNWNNFFNTPSTQITAGTGLTWSGNTLNASGGSAITALTGDVVATGPGSVAATIQPGAVSLSKMANLAANSIIGNNTGSGAAPTALTASQVKTLLAISQADVSGLTTASSPTFAGLTLSSALTVANGGTGASTFGQGWLESPGSTGAIVSSTSPTVNYITATSTTATSTFAFGLKATNLAASSQASGCAQFGTGGYLVSTGSSCGGSSQWTTSGSTIYNNTGTDVGIGTTSPFMTLSVAGSEYLGGNLTATGTLSVLGTGTSTFAGGISANALALGTGGSITVGGQTFLDSSGNLDAVVLPLQDTSSNLASVVPQSGQMVYETNTKESFVGDGTDPVSALSPLNSQWIESGSNLGYTAGQVDIGNTDYPSSLNSDGQVYLNAGVPNGGTGGSGLTSGQLGLLVSQNVADIGDIYGNSAGELLQVVDYAGGFSSDPEGYISLSMSGGGSIGINNEGISLVNPSNDPAIDIGNEPQGPSNGLNGSGDAAVMIAPTSSPANITDTNNLDVNGNAAIGTYAGSKFAPAMGLIVSGNVGIGTSTVPQTLTIQGSVCVTAGHTCPSAVSGKIVAQGLIVQSDFDLAESYNVTDPTVVPGDIVSVDPNNSLSLIKATQGSNIIGIVSTDPGFLLGSSATGTEPIALAGRVPVNVSMENGSINIGDPLTISSTAGVAMKANPGDPIIATALESATEDGSIMVFVRSSMTDGITLGTTTPASELTRGDISLEAEFGNVIAGTEAWVTGKLVAVNGFFDNIFANRVTTQQLCLGDNNSQVCVTKAQLQTLLQNSGQTPTIITTSSTSTPSVSTTTPSSDSSGSGSDNSGNNDDASSTPSSSTPPSSTSTSTPPTDDSSTGSSSSPNTDASSTPPSLPTTPSTPSASTSSGAGSGSSPSSNNSSDTDTSSTPSVTPSTPTTPDPTASGNTDSNTSDTSSQTGTSQTTAPVSTTDSSSASSASQ